MLGINDKARIRQLEDKLNERGASVTYLRVGKRTMIAMITESDGWETIGVAYTQDPANFVEEIGKRWALEDACNKLGQGRFWEGNNLSL